MPSTEESSTPQPRPHGARLARILSALSALVAGALLALASVSYGAEPLHAADAADAADAAEQSPCTDSALRAAVAQLTPAGGGTIALTCSAPLTLTSPITIMDAVSITIGGNVLLTSSGARFFIVRPTASLTLQGLTLTQAHSTGDGGAVYTEGRLVLDHVAMRGNQATRGGALFVSAGAILTVTDSLFEANEASAEGGALYLAGSAALTETQWSGNLAAVGGALRVQDAAHASLDGCLMHDGRGAVAPALSNSGTTRLSRCTITNMVTTADYAAVDNEGRLSLTNVIFLNNKGIDANSLHNHTVTSGSASYIDLLYVTLVNTAPSNRAEIINNGELTMQNSILSVDSGYTCWQGVMEGVKPVFTSLGGNALSDAGCFVAASGDHLHNSPVSVSADVTGRPLVFPTAVSPALDGAACLHSVSIDLRNVVRAQGKGCDSGAVEVIPDEAYYRELLPVVQQN